MYARLLLEPPSVVTPFLISRSSYTGCPARIVCMVLYAQYRTGMFNFYLVCQNSWFYLLLEERKSITSHILLTVVVDMLCHSPHLYPLLLHPSMVTPIIKEIMCMCINNRLLLPLFIGGDTGNCYVYGSVCMHGLP